MYEHENKYGHGGYIYGKRKVDLDFSVSSNPFGMPEGVKEALSTRANEFSNYPDPYCRELVKKLSQVEGVPKEWILCGNGTADLIYRLCRAVNPLKALIVMPTFSEYERALQQTDCSIEYYITIDRNNFDITASIEERLVKGLDMLFLCNPNNPTGRLIESNQLRRIITLARDNNITTVIDECFLDFTDGKSCIKYLDKMKNLVVLKAFTKMYAMAGLRLGYMMTSNAELLSKVSANSQCWSVSVPAQIAGINALSREGWIGRTRRLVWKERVFLNEELRNLGLQVLESDTNFILIRSEKPLYEPLLAKGILIRSCENFKGLDKTYYRVSIKGRVKNRRLLKALREVLGILDD